MKCLKMNTLIRIGFIKNLNYLNIIDLFNIKVINFKLSIVNTLLA